MGDIPKVIEVIIGILIGAAMWNVFFTSQQTSGVVSATTGGTNDILKTLTAH